MSVRRLAAELAAESDAVAALHANDIAFLTYYDAGNFGAASTAASPLT